MTDNVGSLCHNCYRKYKITTMLLILRLPSTLLSFSSSSSNDTRLRKNRTPTIILTFTVSKVFLSISVSSVINKIKSLRLIKHWEETHINELAEVTYSSSLLILSLSFFLAFIILRWFYQGNVFQ
jgi:hypothetical protein